MHEKLTVSLDTKIPELPPVEDIKKRPNKDELDKKLKELDK